MISIGLILSGIGLLALVATLALFLRATFSRRWVSMPGTIIDGNFATHLKIRKTPHGVDVAPQRSLTIVYEYRIGSNVYTGKRIGWSDSIGPPARPMLMLKRSFEAGTDIAVLVNPRDTGDAVLVAGATPAIFIALAFALLLLTTGVLLVIEAV